MNNTYLRALQYWKTRHPGLYLKYGAPGAAVIGGPCPICRGEAPLVAVDGEPWSAGGIPCVCQAGQVEQKARELVAQVTQLPAHLPSIQFSDFQPHGTAAQWQVMRDCMAALQAVVQHPWEAQWVTIWGNPGSGKTRLLRAVRDALPHLAAFVYCDQLADALHAAISDNSVSTLKSQLAEVPVLLIDDLGTEHVNSQFVLGALNGIVNQRYMHGQARPTIVTTNLTRKELNERYARLADRILETETGLARFFALELPTFRQPASAGRAVALGARRPS